MQQKFAQNSSVMPSVMPQSIGAVSSMPAMSHLPPPPPNQPAPLPPPPPENEAFQAVNNSSNDPLSNQRSFQASASASNSRTSNYLSQPVIGQQQFNSRGAGGASGISQSANPFSSHPVRNQYDTSTAKPPVTNDFVAKPLNPIAEDVTEKTPEEKAFDEQFKKWEEEFTRWKQQNANHPDTRAYLEYEQKMEECRTKLLERREQMKRRKLELLQKQQQQQQQQQQPPKITSISLEPQPRNVNEQNIAGYSHSIGSLEKNDPMDNRVGSSDVPPLLENVSNNSSQLFNRDSISSSGIPGLDLVVDTNPTDNDDSGGDGRHCETVIINDVSPIREAKASQQSTINNIQQQRPDLEAISRNITSILGDPNLASLLSNFQSKSIPSAAAKPVIPSLLDMKMPEIDLDTVPRFNWQDDDEDDDDDHGDEEVQDSSVHQQQHQENDAMTHIQSNENTQLNSNHMLHCDDDDDFDPDKEHERFAGDMNYDDHDDVDERAFPMNRLNNDNYSVMQNRQGNFNRNAGNPFGSGNFTNDNEQNGNFSRNRSNFMNDNGSKDNFNQNRGMNNFTNDNFNENRTNFNENMRGNGGNFNQQNSFNFQGNRMNKFDPSGFGNNNSNFRNDRNEMGNNRNNFNGGNNNNFGNKNFNPSMANDQFNGDSEFNARNDDGSNNMNDFCRRRNIQDFDGPNFDTSNSQFPSNYRNNSRSGDNIYSQNSSQPFNNVQNRGLPTDSFISDNAKDEDFFRPTKVIDYSANSKNPTPIATTNDDILKPTKVVDYGHQTMKGIVSRPPQNASHHRPVNKYTGGDFFPVKTIDYNHSSNKHMIKEYYYSIVSKWDPTSSNARPPVQSQPVPNKSDVPDGGSGNIQPIRQRNQPTPNIRVAKQLQEITYEKLSAINTSTKHGKRLKRSLIKKVSV